MSMLRELLEELREYKKMLETSRTDSERVAYVEKLLGQAADTIEELSAKVAMQNMERSSQYYGGGWISCDECMPEKEGNYLIVTNTNHVYIGKFYKNTGFSGVGRYAVYWQSLPLPPKYEPKED